MQARVWLRWIPCTWTVQRDSRVWLGTHFKPMVQQTHERLDGCMVGGEGDTTTTTTKYMYIRIRSWCRTLVQEGEPIQGAGGWTGRLWNTPHRSYLDGIKVSRRLDSQAYILQKVKGHRGYIDGQQNTTAVRGEWMEVPALRALAVFMRRNSVETNRNQ